MSKTESKIIMGFIGSLIGSAIGYSVFSSFKIACISFVVAMLFVIIGSLLSVK